MFEKILGRFGRPRKLKLALKIFFVQQLGVMVKSGISLAVALKTLAEQTSSKSFRKILADIQQGVEKGNLLSKGLEQYQYVFGDLFINMIKAGEASGKLEDVLNQLFIQMKKDNEIISKVKGAMIYPMIVIAMMVAIGVLVLVYVIPTMSGIFLELNVTLPLPTRILIASSQFAVTYGIFIAIAAVVGIIALNRIIKTKEGKLKFHQLLLKMPVAGTIIKKINLARFCRTLSSLLKTDIPIVQSFEITARILGNALFKNALSDAKEKIKKGVNIKDSLTPYMNLFPPVVLQMIAVGEETGSLDEILEESASFYEEDVRQTMENLPSIIEPLLMVLLGIGVGGMAVAIIMPMYSLSQAI
ncbi:MAG: type II secretion system F family protein [Candidatus Buchananbacteria bacterium]|nr:type II secretion system F family protein [Candidatus Buchananbacteria bacterium]